jgi:2,4-dienoyl-CoA reductase-like NADH-dependent reductase (Old Yellow Enzyme family)
MIAIIVFRRPSKRIGFPHGGLPGAKMLTIVAHLWRTTRRTFLSAGIGLSILDAAEERRIFSSGRIGNLRLKNRLVRSATSEAACRQGVMTDEGIAIYRALGQGGAGLIISGHMAAMAGGRDNQLQTCIYDDRFIPSIRRIAEAVHGARNGCKVLAQITHTAPEGQLAAPSQRRPSRFPPGEDSRAR